MTVEVLFLSGINSSRAFAASERQTGVMTSLLHCPSLVEGHFVSDPSHLIRSVAVTDSDLLLCGQSHKEKPLEHLVRVRRGMSRNGFKISAKCHLLGIT